MDEFTDAELEIARCCLSNHQAKDLRGKRAVEGMHHDLLFFLVKLGNLKPVPGYQRACAIAAAIAPTSSSSSRLGLVRSSDQVWIWLPERLTVWVVVVWPSPAA